MARRQMTSRRQNRRSPPNRSWTGTSSGSVAVAGGAAVLLGSIVLSNDNIDETILRIVGQVSISSDQDAASELQQGAFGIIRASTAAITAGVASVPTPITEIADDGWMVFVPFTTEMEFNSAIGVMPNWATQFNFDSKAKRVVEDGNALAMVVETTAASFGFEFSMILRVLSMVRGT